MSSKDILQFNLKLYVQFHSLKRETTTIPTLHGHVIYLTTTRSVPTLVKPSTIISIHSSLVPMIITLVPIILLIVLV